MNKYFIGATAITIIGGFVHAKTTITSTGGSVYEVVFENETVSEHSTPHKAIESALAVLETECCTVYIRQSLELRVVKTETPNLASVELTWDRPTARENGAELPPNEVAGYVIAYGTEETKLDTFISIEGVNVLRTTVTDLTKGTYYFAIATVDSEGVQGAFSTTIRQTL